MSPLRTYQCPNCGGSLHYDPKTGQLRCEQCDSLFYPFDFRDELAKKSGVSGEQFDQKSMMVYRCPNCGAEIITSSEPLVTQCAYCGSEIVLTGGLPEKFKPNWIIPFNLTKEDAEEAYNKAVRQNVFAPARFRKNAQLEKMQGMYIPVWLFSYSVYGGITCRGSYRKKQAFDLGNAIGYSFYGANGRFREEAEITFDRIAEDGLEKLDDRFIEALGPYDFWNTAYFNSAYLTGFSAQRWDTDEETMKKRAEQRIGDAVKEELVTRTWQEVYSDFTEEELQKEGRSYDTRASREELRQTSDFSCKIEDVTAEQALVPVWLMYTEYRGKKYFFGVNGQNGSVAGDIPRSPFRIAVAAAAAGGLPLLFFVILFLNPVFYSDLREFLIFLPFLILALVKGYRNRVAGRLRERKSVTRLNEAPPLLVRTCRTIRHEEL